MVKKTYGGNGNIGPIKTLGVAIRQGRVATETITTMFAIILRGISDHPVEVGESAVAFRIRNVQSVGYGGRWNS